LKEHAARELAPYRSRMGAVQLRQVERQFVQKQLAGALQPAPAEPVLYEPAMTLRKQITAKRRAKQAAKRLSGGRKGKVKQPSGANAPVFIAGDMRGVKLATPSAFAIRQSRNSSKSRSRSTAEHFWPGWKAKPFLCR
jgi:hypothetical protein